jgi:hypothetical protein
MFENEHLDVLLMESCGTQSSNPEPQEGNLQSSSCCDNPLLLMAHAAATVSFVGTVPSLGIL